MISIQRKLYYFRYLMILGTVFQCVHHVSSSSSLNNSNTDYYYDDDTSDNSTVANSTILTDDYTYYSQIETSGNGTSSTEESRQLKEITDLPSEPINTNELDEVTSVTEPIPDQLPVESVLSPEFYGGNRPDQMYAHYGSAHLPNYVGPPSALSVPVLPNMGSVPLAAGGSYLEPMSPYIPDMSPAFSLPPPPAVASMGTAPMKTEIMIVKDGKVTIASDVTVNHQIHSPDPQQIYQHQHTSSQGHKSQHFEEDDGSYFHQHNAEPDHSVGDLNGWPMAEKNPIVKSQEFMQNLMETLSDVSKTDVILWIEKLLTVVAEMKIPQEHYVRVVSFAGIYLFLAIMYYGRSTVFDWKCEIENRSRPAKHYSYHAGRRFVPARTVDPALHTSFLDLFRGVDDDDKEDDYVVDPIVYTVVNRVEDLCPRDAFFFSLSPKHVQATFALQELFVAQRTPADVIALARNLLHSKQIHPKVWYISLVAASNVRPDMTGYSLAHPIDAIPDWFIPAHLITDLMRKYKKIRIKRALNETQSVKPSRHKSTTRAKKPKKKLTYHTGGIINIDMANNSEESSNFTVFSPTAITTKRTTTTTTTTTTKKRTTTTSTTTTPAPPTTTTSKGVHYKNGSVFDVDILFGGKGKTSNKDKEENDDLPLLRKTSFKNVTYSKLHHDFVHHDQYNQKRNQNQNKKKKKKPKKKKKKRRKKKKKGKKKDYYDDDCILVDWRVGIDNGIENRLWYFREDMMVNQHHWYWHQIHSPNATIHADRRAEMFFFMHRNFLARYNAERLSNGLPRVIPMEVRPGGVVYDGYNSHMADVNSGIFWTPRYPQTPLADILHDDDRDFARRIMFGDYLTSYNRLVKAIQKGRLLAPNRRVVPINSMFGIEPLANTVEASDISVNPWFYDPSGIHNLGHVIVGLASDPDFRFRKVAGVMADTALAMRDPAFYPFHQFMDNVFELYKERLPPYRLNSGEFPLLWKGVQIVKIELISQGGGPPNELRTFWTHHRFPLSPGVDRSIDKGEDHEIVCAKHLDHEPFHFQITIDRKPCLKTKSGKATVRIFMAPRFDEQGKRMPLKQQRRFFFMLDVFPVKLKLGRNLITRYAEDSSLTQPWTKSLRDLTRGPDSSGGADFCGCGWPQHLLIPKGDVVGMAYDLFVMITSYDEDYVPNDPRILELPETCNSPYIFCGLPRRRYPDARPMNYPFDRPFFKAANCPSGYTFGGKAICRLLNYHREVRSLEEYASQAPNMAALKFTIKHLDMVFPEPARHR